MPLAVLPLVLLAAVFHAAWNALLKASENPLSLAARAIAWGTVISLPPVAVAWIVAGRPGLPLAGWLLALASALPERCCASDVFRRIIVGLAVSAASADCESPGCPAFRDKAGSTNHQRECKNK